MVDRACQAFHLSSILPMLASGAHMTILVFGIWDAVVSFWDAVFGMLYLVMVIILMIMKLTMYLLLYVIYFAQLQGGF